MTRKELQTLAQVRIDEALALLAAKHWSGAYYMAGYAVECGLKACITKRVKRYTFPDKDLAQKCFTHNLDELARLAGLEDSRKTETAEKTAFGDNWLTVRDWNEKARYQLWTRTAAQGLVTAVSHESDGVLQWVKRHW